MTRWIIVTISLGAILAGSSGVAVAQGNAAPVIHSNASATCVVAPTGNPLGANSGDWTISCGDIGPGSGLTVIGPPVVESAPLDVAPGPAVAPAPVAAPAPETTEEAAATGTDLDADNFADALEWDAGLDPSNPDSDGDGVADGDEAPIYGTDPRAWDTDGDGRSDGEEIFATHTDPLVWTDATTEANTLDQQQEATGPAPSIQPQSDATSLPQTLTDDVTATNGDAAALGTGAASAAPGRVTRGDVSESSVLGPDGTYSVTETSPPDVTVGESGDVAPAPEPAPESIETGERVEPVVADTTTAAATDLDADNYADEQELAIGLDPNNPDTDGDGVADGDEITIYGTDAFSWDTDGDGVSDGEELFAALTDPLTWNAADTGAASSEGGAG
jgi:hypothetical protein